MLRACASRLGAAVQGAPAAAAAAQLLGARGLSAAHPQPADSGDHHGGGSSPEELEEFRESVRTFAADFVAPHAAEIDRLNAYPPGFEFWRTAGEWGLHGERGAPAPALRGRRCSVFCKLTRRREKDCSHLR